MTWLASSRSTVALGGRPSARVGSALLGLALTLAFASPGLTAGTGDITQLAGNGGLDGCVSKDGTEGGTTTLTVVCETELLLSNPKAVATSADGKHVYVAQSAGGKVLIFTRNKAVKKGLTVGALVLPAGSATASGAHKALIVSPDGKHVYVTAGTNLYMFGRDKKSGALTALTPPKLANLKTPEGLAITKEGNHVYVAARGLQGVMVLDRNKKTGLLTASSCASEGGASDGCTLALGLKGATDVAISHDSKSVYVTADVSNALAVFSRDKKTGGLTQAASPDGCWSHTGQDGSIGPILCQEGRGLDGANGIAIPTDGKFVYVSSSNSNAVAIFSRNVKTGEVTQLADVDGCVSQGGNDGNTAAGVGRCTAADIGGLTKVEKVVISKNGDNLYTTSKGTVAATPHKGAVAAFTRDETTGGLTQLSCVGPDDDCADTGAGLHRLQGIAVTDDGKSVYVTSAGDDAIGAFERDK